jgi:hypothetical protein
MGGILGAVIRPRTPIVYGGLNVSTSQWNLPVPIFWGTPLDHQCDGCRQFQKHAQSAKGGKGAVARAVPAYLLGRLLPWPVQGPVDAIRISGRRFDDHDDDPGGPEHELFPRHSRAGGWSYWATKHGHDAGIQPDGLSGRGQS